ncbi:MAG: hypothetical protein P857_750 [Candidatus Xenolissoclinum pacificiensis L6]|uniref:Uncharacterized protein n=1 Tax=Candidatus Xenolissoclinum pacificiensis L6 TaxID=1401685 RepID=W2UYS3_9RICK|nr:MAG: hypothetical protein P857_750 [Candidatus Xenolissoclinum pacificiensis L6]
MHNTMYKDKSLPKLFSAFIISILTKLGGATTVPPNSIESEMQELEILQKEAEIRHLNAQTSLTEATTVQVGITIVIMVAVIFTLYVSCYCRRRHDKAHQEYITNPTPENEIELLKSKQWKKDIEPIENELRTLLPLTTVFHLKSDTSTVLDDENTTSPSQSAKSSKTPDKIEEQDHENDQQRTESDKNPKQHYTTKTQETTKELIEKCQIFIQQPHTKYNDNVQEMHDKLEELSTHVKNDECCPKKYFKIFDEFKTEAVPNSKWSTVQHSLPTIIQDPAIEAPKSKTTLEDIVDMLYSKI